MSCDWLNALAGPLKVAARVLGGRHPFVLVNPTRRIHTSGIKFA